MSDAVEVAAEASGARPPRAQYLPRSSRTRRAMLEASGLPRSGRGQRHDNVEGAEWVRYLGDLCLRVGLVERPVPRWSTEILRQAGRAHLVLVHVQGLLDAEAAAPVPSRQEARRLRSEVRRCLSQRGMLERTLAAIVAERKAEARKSPTVGLSLLDRVGR